MAVNISEKLKLQELKCTFEHVEAKNVDELLELARKYCSDNALVVVWHINSISWGKYIAGGISLADSGELNFALCQEIRIFDDSRELHLVKNKGRLVGRAIIDGEGDNISVVDTIAPIWGTVKKCENGYTKISDNARKIYMTVPVVGNVGSRMGLITRNYVFVSKDTGLAGYGDYRFVTLQALEV